MRFPALLRTALLLGALGAAAPGLAQTIPPVGTDSTLDVATWNTRWFGSTTQAPTNDTLQFRNVLAVLRQAQIDVWGLQELAHVATAQRLFDSLAVSGYVGVLGPQVSSNPSFDQRLGFVYNPTVIQPLQVGPVLTGSAQFFGGRAPLQMRANVTLPDTTIEVRFITIHAKAGSTVSDYDQRVAGSAALKNYVDNLRSLGAHVVVLGDMNDRLVTSITGGGRPSPYQNFRDDTAGYYLATLAMDQNLVFTYCGSSTSCSSGSTIDHVFLTANLADDFQAAGRYAALLSAFPGASGPYVTTTSDHLPAWTRLRFTPPTTSAEPGAPGRALALAAPSPNPFDGAAALAYTLDRPAEVRLEVFDALGRRVAVVDEGPRAAGEHRASLDGAALAPGLYLIRLTAGGATAGRTVTRR